MRISTQLDATWRLLDRKVSTFLHPDVDGEDCYVFRRAGGDKPTDLYTVHIIPVEAFWGAGAAVGR